MQHTQDITEDDAMRQETKERIREYAIRRQNVIFSVIVGAGFAMLGIGWLGNQFLVVEGIAFIIIGGVGLVMSWTTMDIGDKLMETVERVGLKNEVYLKAIAASQGEMTSTLKNLESSQGEMTSTLKNLESSQGEMTSTLKNLESSQGEMTSTLKDIRDLLRK